MKLVSSELTCGRILFLIILVMGELLPGKKNAGSKLVEIPDSLISLLVEIP